MLLLFFITILHKPKNALCIFVCTSICCVTGRWASVCNWKRELFQDSVRLMDAKYYAGICISNITLSQLTFKFLMLLFSLLKKSSSYGSSGYYLCKISVLMKNFWSVSCHLQIQDYVISSGFKYLSKWFKIVFLDTYTKSKSFNHT